MDTLASCWRLPINKNSCYHLNLLSFKHNNKNNNKSHEYKNILIQHFDYVESFKLLYKN